MLRKFIATIMTLALVFSAALPMAQAADAYPDESTVTVLYGEIAKTASGKLQLTHEEERYLLNLQDSTQILDATTFAKMSLNDIRNGDKIYAYVSKAMTKSDPPQTNAIILLAGAPLRYKAPTYSALLSMSANAGKYTLLEGSIEKLASGRVRLSTEDKGTYMLLMSKAMIFDFQARKLVKLDDMKDGQKVAAYVSSVMTFSLPPQTSAVVVLTNLPSGFQAPSVAQALEYVKNLMPKDEVTYVWGSVRRKQGDSLFIENSNENDPLNSVILNVAKDTMIVDAVNGENRTLDNIKVGDIIYGYIKPYLALSQPPQATPVLLICDVPMDFATPLYYTIDSVSPEGDGVSLKTTDGESFVVNANTEIVTYRTDNIPNLSDLAAGKKVLVWTNARNLAYKVMLFN